MKTTLFLTVAATFLFGLSPQASWRAAAAATPGSTTQAKKAKKPAAKPAEDPLKQMNLAKQAITAFFQAGSVEEMAKHVRHPEKSLPRMKAFYAEKGVAPVKVEFTDDVSEVDKGKLTFITTRVKIELESQFVAVEVPRKGPAKVDWESLSGWCEMPWAGFVKDGSEKPVELRLRLSESDYFNWSFADAGKYACFKVTDKADEETIYCYCEKDSELYKKLKAALPLPKPGETAPAPVAVTVKLSMKPADAPRHQAVIESFVCDGWLEL